jgi:hypothetical protein
VPVIIAALFCAGLFLIFCDILRVPHMRTSKAVKSLSKRQQTKTGTLEVWMRDLTEWLSRFIRINEYKRLQLVSDLQTAGMNVTPELHIAKAFVKAVPIGLLALPGLYIFPLITPLIIATSITYYFREVRSVQGKILQKRNAINFELPRLVSTIDKTLEHSRDVLTMLEDYKRSAAPELRDELAVTVADMRSGNYESALTRLEARVGSSMLSDVTRGLIGVLRGDETRLYWSALSVKFADMQRQMLKQQAQKVPSKVKKLSMCLLVCFLLTYLVVIVVEVMSSLGAIFS